MTNAALVALTAPAQYPQAALARLGDTAAALLAESLSSRAGSYAELLACLAAIAQRAVPIMNAVLAATASEAELAGVVHAERLARAGRQLFAELAGRRSQGAQIDAMRWHQGCRHLLADLTLLRREFAPTALVGVNWPTANEHAPIRWLPGAESAMTQLAQDPLRAAACWDLETLADSLARWVRVT